MRAVFYCRVSTDEEKQINALESQIGEAKQCILSNDWELCDGYVDEGKTGTTTNKRSEYMRLFKDLRINKFDIVVVKSQDRLMRNTKDWYIFIDALVNSGKQLFFYLENKFYTPDDALINGIKAMLAEEYSKELSKKIKNAHVNRQNKCSSVLLTSATWGYDKVGKAVVINEKEAEIVRLIYNLCIQGYGSRLISKELSNRGIRSRSGGYFPEITIRKIIRNPLFKGVVVMNKKNLDFYTKKSVLTDESEWKIHKDAVPAIVTSAIWEEANSIMDTRSRILKSEEFAEKRVGHNLGKYDLSSRIFCGACGSKYWRKYRRNSKTKEKVIDWTCSEYIRRGRKKGMTIKEGCDNPNIRESNLMRMLSEIAQTILKDEKELIIYHTMNIIKSVLDKSSIEAENLDWEKTNNKLNKQKDLLLEKLLNGIISDKDFKKKDADLEDQLRESERKKYELEKNILNLEEIPVRVNDIRLMLDIPNNGFDIETMQTAKLIKHVKKISVFPDRLEIFFDFCDKITVKYSANTNLI